MFMSMHVFCNIHISTRYIQTRNIFQKIDKNALFHVTYTVLYMFPYIIPLPL